MRAPGPILCIIATVQPLMPKTMLRLFLPEGNSAHHCDIASCPKTSPRLQQRSVTTSTVPNPSKSRQHAACTRQYQKLSSTSALWHRGTVCRGSREMRGRLHLHDRLRCPYRLRAKHSCTLPPYRPHVKLGKGAKADREPPRETKWRRKEKGCASTTKGSW